MELNAGGREDRRHRILLILAVALIALGAAERVRQYQARTSFWGDEAFVLMNLRHKTPAQLAGKLEYDQAAPPGFLWVIEGMRHIFGEGEYSLRFVPMAVSVMGAIVFGVVAWNMLPAEAAVLAIGLFSLARRLVEYSAQIKQYGCDAAISALLIGVALGRKDRSAPDRLMRTAMVASIAVWFSHPVAIVFGGISSVLSIACFRRRKHGQAQPPLAPSPGTPGEGWGEGHSSSSWQENALTLPSPGVPGEGTRGSVQSVAIARGGNRDAFVAIGANAIFAISFGALYFLSIRRQHTDYLFRYWRSAFPDWHRPGRLPIWLATQLFAFLQTPYRWPGLIFAALIGLAIVWAIRKREEVRWAACAAPIALAAVAACVRQYPFDGGRLTLFLMPELFLLVGAGAAMLLEMIPANVRALWWALPAALIGTGIVQGAGRLLHPAYGSNIRPAVEYVMAHRRPGEALALTGERVGDIAQLPYNGRHVEALCYWPHPPAPLYTNIKSLQEIRERRIWVLMTFDPSERKKVDRGSDPAPLLPFLRELRAIGVQKDRMLDEHGGAAYLFERPADPSYHAK